MYRSPLKTRKLSISLTTNDTTNQWIFPVAQTVKNLLAMQETWVQSLGWEDPLEKVMAIHSSIPARRIPWTEDSVVHGAAESRT